jgi:uncharacterized membrane protein YgaE (UPF0421/DUF939 family)
VSGCEETQCDCEKLAVLVSIGIGVATLAIAVILKNKEALFIARQAIARAMRTSKEKATQKELQQAEEELAIVDEDLSATQEQWEMLLDKLRQAEQNSFGTGGTVVIKPDA